MASDPTPTGTFTSSTNLMIGRRGGDNAEPWIGLIDDASAWNRDLSASEVVQDYRESRAGYPNALNWLPEPFNSTQADAGTGITWRLQPNAYTLGRTWRVHS